MGSNCPPRTISTHRSPSLRQPGALARVTVGTSLWMSLGMASLTAFSSHAMGLETTLEPPLLLFVSALFIYNLDHARDARDDDIADPLVQNLLRTDWMKWAITLMGLATALLVWLAPPAARLVFLGYGATGVLYTIPFIPMPSRDGLRWLRFKDIPGFKAWLVAAAVTLAVVGLPLAYAGAPMTADGALVAGGLFILLSTNAHLFDVSDVTADSLSGARTLPSVIGVAHTRNLLVFINLFAAVGLGISGTHPPLMMAAAAMVAIIPMVSPRSSRLRTSLIVDGSLYVPMLLGLVYRAIS